MSKLLDRGPDGKFLSYGTAIAAWLPVLLNEVSWENPLPLAISSIMLWCEHRAAKEYRNASEALDEDRARWLNAEERAKTFAAQADRWFRRKAVLAKALEELKQI